MALSNASVVPPDQIATTSSTWLLLIHGLWPNSCKQLLSNSFLDVLLCKRLKIVVDRYRSNKFCQLHICRMIELIIGIICMLINILKLTYIL